MHRVIAVMTARDFSVRAPHRNHKAIDCGTLDGDPCPAQATLAALGIAPAHRQATASSPYLNVTPPAGFAAIPAPYHA